MRSCAALAAAERSCAYPAADWSESSSTQEKTASARRCSVSGATEARAPATAKRRQAIRPPSR